MCQMCPTSPIKRKTVAMVAAQKFDFDVGLLVGRDLLKVEPTSARPNVERGAQNARHLIGLHLLRPTLDAEEEDAISRSSFGLFSFDKFPK